MIPLISGAMLLILLTVLSAALGRRLLILLKLRPNDPLEHGVLAMGLGLGAIQFLPFVLFTIGIGRPGGIRAGTALLALILLSDSYHVIRSGLVELVSLIRLPGWQKILVVVFTGLFVCMFLRSRSEELRDG